nr:hypothetical protein [Tanacetum cinerariifolium]
SSGRGTGGMEGVSVIFAGEAEDGVPGGVRTCNLPLRRGMLYPIELLRHSGRRSEWRQRDGDDGSKAGNAANTESVAVQAQPHYLMKQAPRFVAQPAHRSDAMLANDTDEAIPRTAMSKAALSFLILAIMAIAVDQLLPVSMDTLSTAAKTAAGIFASLFLAALFVGRRIKFDPVLRQAKP